MRLFRTCKLVWEDSWQKLCHNKWKTICCALVAVAGVVVGVVLTNVFRYSWWFENRCEYASKLFDGGFGLFFSFLLWTAVYFLCLAMCNVFPSTKYLSCAALFAACFYCGANTMAAILYWSVWGVLFALLVTAVEVVGYFAACLVTCCEPSCCRTLKEAFCDAKLCFWVLAAAFLVKIVSFFVILRIITAVI